MTIFSIQGYSQSEIANQLTVDKKILITLNILNNFHFSILSVNCNESCVCIKNLNNLLKIMSKFRRQSG